MPIDSTTDPLPSPDLPDDVWDALAQSEKDAVESYLGGFTSSALKPVGILPLKPADPIPVTGVRRCHGCNTLYAAASAAPTPQVCPVCHSEHTVVAEAFPWPPDGKLSEVGPTQATLFTIPAPPRPNCWCVEWKWKPAIQEALASVIKADVLPANDWVRHSAYNITTERQAINQCVRLRRCFPGKKYRVKVVGWVPTPLLP